MYLLDQEVKIPFYVWEKCLDCDHRQLACFDEGKSRRIEFAECGWCGEMSAVFVSPIMTAN